MNTSKNLTIFEGADGSGKSTAAKEYADQVGARYVHFPALPRVKGGLARMYVEAMLPALLGYQDVVFDRCWLSEWPYGETFREGRDRLTQADRRMLERLAMRCGGVVVRCSPPWETVKKNFIKRKGQEMLKSTTQLRQVYEIYLKQHSELPVVDFDFTKEKLRELYESSRLDSFKLHPTSLASAGNWEATTLLVGENFAERKDQDPWYQAPFVSFSGEGCSQWLTQQLDEAGVPENQLLWANADQDLSFINEHLGKVQVVALGAVAADALEDLDVTHEVVPHPQSWKRFNSSKIYPLLDLIGD